MSDAEPIKLKTRIEAILYLKGQPLTIAALSELTGGEKTEVEDAIIDLMSDYSYRDSALEVIETPAGYCLQLRSLYRDLIETLVPAELGKGTLKTLATIALKNPILQTDLIAIRGSGAYQQVQELVREGFIRKRRQSEGRSYWLEITEKFHQYFEVDRSIEREFFPSSDTE